MTTTGRSQRFVAALAALVHECRDGWDEPGIAAAIRRCPDVPLTQLAIAFLRAAEDAANDTPAAVTFLDNRAWDSDWYPPCKTHPEQTRFTTSGECASCKADRIAATAPPPRREPTPIPAADRELMLTTIWRTPRHRDTTVASPDAPPVKDRPPFTPEELKAAAKLLEQAKPGDGAA